MSVPLADRYSDIRKRLEQLQRNEAMVEDEDALLIGSLGAAERARWAVANESPLLTPQADYYNRVVRACRRWLLSAPPRP